jgi:hypothetical protein
MGGIVRFVAKSELERARLIREASAICDSIFAPLIGLFRSRASLQAKILTLRHQLNVLRRKSPQRLAFTSIDRRVFAGLYRLAPGVLDALKIVRPETRDPLASCRLPTLIPTALRVADSATRSPPNPVAGSDCAPNG